MHFRFPKGYTPPALDLLSELHDPVPRRLQEILRLYIDYKKLPLHAALKAKLDDIYRGSQTTPNLTFADLPEFIHGLPRWHKVALAVLWGRAILGLFPKAAPQDVSKAQALDRALQYGEAACRTASSQPGGFSYADTAAADAVEKALQGGGLEYHVARAVACAAGISQVHVWDTSAECGLAACMMAGTAALTEATARGILTNAARQTIEDRLVAAGTNANAHAYSARWADIPVDVSKL
jgi:hypothetical protein